MPISNAAQAVSLGLPPSIHMARDGETVFKAITLYETGSYVDHEVLTANELPDGTLLRIALSTTKESDGQMQFVLGVNAAGLPARHFTMQSALGDAAVVGLYFEDEAYFVAAQSRDAMLDAAPISGSFQGTAHITVFIVNSGHSAGTTFLAVPSAANLIPV